MAYPDNKPTGNYTLRDYDFANLDQNKLPMDEYLFKNGYKNADESELDSIPDAHNQNWLFDLLHRNLRYTMGVAEENKNLLENKVATPTSIGQVKIGYGLEVSANGTLSVVKGVAEDANIISYDLPVGSYMLWAGNNPPDYFIEPKGQTLSRSQYPELWEFAKSNNLIGTLFGEGNGSTTFTVTDIRGNFISIANSNDKVGKFTQAGLPNITGNFATHQDKTLNMLIADGAFSRSVLRERAVIEPEDNQWHQTTKITFNASRSNSIYGKSTTVTPANWGLKIILKALPTPPSSAVPTGTILSYTGSSVPDGYIIPNGAEVSRTTFSNLYQWAVTNNLIKNQSSIPNTPHAYYGSGNGSTTFTLPDLRGVFLKNADLASNRNGTALGVYQPINTDRVLVKKYVSGTNWYNLYSDGWIEQGGRGTTGTTVTFLKPFSNANYCLQVLINDTDNETAYENLIVKNVTATGFLPSRWTWKHTCIWSACGYGPKPAVSEYTYKSGSVSITPILKY